MPAAGVNTVVHIQGDRSLSADAYCVLHVHIYMCVQRGQRVAPQRHENNCICCTGRHSRTTGSNSSSKQIEHSKLL
jgi:hypothetical protein